MKEIIEKKIPKDLVECIECFILSMKREQRESFKKMPEEGMIAIHHHTTGRNIRNDWGLWDKKSPLYHYFKSLGLWHPDDISSVILTTLHRMLNHQPAQLKDQIQYYQQYWEKMKEAENEH